MIAGRTSSTFRLVQLLVSSFGERSMPPDTCSIHASTSTTQDASIGLRRATPAVFSQLSRCVAAGERSAEAPADLMSLRDQPEVSEIDIRDPVDKAVLPVDYPRQSRAIAGLADHRVAEPAVALGQAEGQRHRGQLADQRGVQSCQVRGAGQAAGEAGE